MSEASNVSNRRYSLGQALERWPEEIFAPLGGAMFHAIAEHLSTPRTYCTAVCGFSGFAPAWEFEASTDQLVCLRCTKELGGRQ